jgi:hypothetical protein
VLDTEGTAVFATPNSKKGYHRQTHGFHRILYDPDHFEGLLSRFFDEVRLYGVTTRSALPVLRPFLRLGKRILLNTGLHRIKHVQNSVARVSTGTAHTNFTVREMPVKNPRHLIALCTSPKNARCLNK